MKIVAILALFAAFAPCRGADSGEAMAEPQAVLKMVSAMESSGISGLVSSKDEQGTSYHLRKVELLGTVNRSGKTYTIGHVVFVRSSPPERETPPSRGHGFIVVFGPDFGICGVGRNASGEYYMKGEKLYSGVHDVKREPCADFGCTRALTRYRGFPEIGLEYPFPDKISEKDWQSGAFLKSLSEVDRKSGLYPER